MQSSVDTLRSVFAVNNKIVKYGDWPGRGGGDLRSRAAYPHDTDMPARRVRRKRSPGRRGVGDGR